MQTLTSGELSFLDKLGLNRCLAPFLGGEACRMHVVTTRHDVKRAIRSDGNIGTPDISLLMIFCHFLKRANESALFPSS